MTLPAEKKLSEDTEACRVNYQKWERLRSLFTRIRRRYVVETPKDDLQQLFDFGDVLKEWHSSTLLEVAAFDEWKLLEKYEVEMLTMCDLEESEVYLEIWRSEKMIFFWFQLLVIIFL